MFIAKGQIVSLLNIKMEPDGRFPSLYKMDFFVRPGRIITVTVLQDPHISLLTEWTKTESILAFSIMETVEQMLCFLSLVTDQGGFSNDNHGNYSYADISFPVSFSHSAFIVIPVTYSGGSKPSRRDSYAYYPLIAEISNEKCNVCIDGDEAFWIALGY